MLTHQEKESLYNIIAATFGDDATLKQHTLYFNEQTVVVVEDAIAAKIKCNQAMKELVIGLLQGGGAFAKGWLRKLLRTSKKTVEKQNFQLDGYACMATAKSAWKTRILETTI